MNSRTRAAAHWRRQILVFAVVLVSVENSMLGELLLQALELVACQAAPELCSDDEQLLLLPTLRLLGYWAVSRTLSGPESDKHRRSDC